MNYKTRNPFVDAAFAQTQRPFRRKVITLSTAITDQFIDLAGDFLYIDQASTGYVTIELNSAEAGTLDPITLGAGGAIEANFANFKISAPAQLNKSVTLIVGNGARIKGGANVNADSASLSVVDGSLARTLANEAFVGTGNNTATAAQLAHAQLWNPSTSGKNLYLPQFLVTVETAQSVITGLHTAAYTTASTMLHSKKLNGAAPSGQIRAMTSGGATITTYGLQMIFPSAGAYFHKFAEPLVIPPGYGFCLISATVNTRIFFSPEWYEK